MKKLLIVLLALVLIPLLTACGKTKFVLYNYGGYIDLDLLADFEALYDVDVIYQEFTDSNEAYEKILVESYDLVIPSDYIIERCAKEDLIFEIDWSKLTHFSKAELNNNLKAQLEYVNSGDNAFDLLKYAVPYFWGNFGIIYDSSIPGLEAEVISEGWNILNTDLKVGSGDDERGIKFGIYDSPRDIMMVALKANGKSGNTTSVDDVNVAEAWLNNVKTDLTQDRLYITTEAMLEEMIENNGERMYDVGINYSGDGIKLMQADADLKYHVPSQGTNIWIDGMIIPKNANNVDLSYKFLDFITSYESQLANAEYVCYATCSQAVLDTVYGAGGAFAGITAYNIPKGVNDETFHYSQTNSELISAAYSRFRNN